MSYLDNETNYRNLIQRFLTGQLAVAEFVDAYVTQWKLDSDEEDEREARGEMISGDELALTDVLTQIFAACDVYAAEPEAYFQLDEQALRKEVQQYFSKRWE